MCMYAIKLTIKFDKLQHKIKPVTMVCYDLSKSKRIKKKFCQLTFIFRYANRARLFPNS